MHEGHVVIEDPKGEFLPGALIDTMRAMRVGARGVIALPVDVRLFARGGACGYDRREWGDGYAYDGSRMLIGSGMHVFATPEHKRIYWAAKLVCDAEIIADVRTGVRKVAGQLQLQSDSSVTPMRAGLGGLSAAVRLAELGAPDVDGCWIIRGSADVNFGMDGFYGFGLYGTCTGALVRWAAITICAR